MHMTWHWLLPRYNQRLGHIDNVIGEEPVTGATEMLDRYWKSRLCATTTPWPYFKMNCGWSPLGYQTSGPTHHADLRS
jgi:hypothetical protein